MVFSSFNATFDFSVDHDSGPQKEENIKIWSDEELQTNIDSLLQIYDRNYDGEITWVEFAAKSLV